VPEGRGSADDGETPPSHEESGDADPIAPRKLRRILFDRTFGTYYTGKLGSLLGLWVTNITAALLIFDITGSAFFVGLISILQFAPQILFAPWIGALIDRADRRRVVIAGQGISMAGNLALAAWIWAAGTDGLPGVWPVIVAVGLSGMGNAVTSPSTQSILPALVPPRDLFGAITLNSSVASLSRALGPAIGAFLYVGLGAAWGFAAGALGNLALAVAMLALGSVGRQPRRGSRASALGGLKYVKDTPAMLVLLLCIAGVGFGVDLTITLTPPLAAEFGGDEAFVGTLASVFGLGAVAAIAFSGPLERLVGLTRVGVVGLGAMAVGYSLVAATGSQGLALAGMFVAGIGFLFSNSSLTSRIQKLVPEEYRGRVMALWSVGYFGSRPIAAAINGAVADATSAKTAVLISIVVTGAAAYLAFRSSRWAGTRAAQ
jgi:MFS family permease